MSNPTEQNLQLELLVTEHERVLEQYSELFQNQQLQIDRLKARIGQLEQKLGEHGDDSDTDLVHEPPPHY